MNEIKSINDMPLHDTVARASITELRNEINNIEDSIDLSDYALKTDLSDYTTKSYVDDAIANVSIEGVDLSEYAKKTDIPIGVSAFTNDAGYLTRVPSEFITEVELADRKYALEANVPTKVSQLTNDSGYLTNIPEEYLTEDEINELLENVNTEKIAHVFLTKEEYNALTNEEKNDESILYIITDTDEDINLNNYATKAYVDNLIGDVGALLDTLNGEVI